MYYTDADFAQAMDALGIVGIDRLVIHELLANRAIRGMESYGLWNDSTAMRAESLEFRMGLDPDKLFDICRGLSKREIIGFNVHNATVSSVWLGRVFAETVQEFASEREQKDQERTSLRAPVHKGVKGALRLDAHLLFESTCELCGLQGEQGRDGNGNKLIAARIVKDGGPYAENVTLVCRSCVHEFRGIDLPLECRTVAQMRIAREKGNAAPRRVATKPPPKRKQITIEAIGLGKVTVVDADNGTVT
ncbi:MAG: hypothetical protein JNN24_03385 [Hyphomicrobium zavarzinii]|uniref:hypothetical protein n=1 Tax=Hyphomicrobium zavarzinii TaxID=48292 RepID=UPI001A488993|nr:hypothetical protein [Hyphomicrobium zavarzinii]MBL8844793.1 hypothetical protein [Hyphomicrobium zavarzinii]